MMRDSRAVFSVVILVFSGCTILQSGRQALRPALSFEEAKQIKIGKATQADILDRFGKPDRIINPSESQGQVDDIIWAYFEDNDPTAGRIAVLISPESGIVQTVSWDVRDRDPEQNLDVALSRFKDKKFVKVFPKWDNPHSAPDEIYYEVEADGLTIAYLRTPKRVAAISWSVPENKTRKPSSTRPRVPYCIVGLCAPLADEY